MANEFRSIGRVITPNEPGYSQACQLWNERFDAQPRKVVYCQNAQEVSAALLSALDQDIPFRARCGGHSYEGFSTIEEGIVIDVSEINTISANSDRTVAVIGSGGHLGDVYSRLFQLGVTIPAGTCPGVGISGLTLGGGLGMLVRSRGLLIDSLLGVEMVDARGQIITADESNNPDLFWACRGGGGGNFGIMTSLTFRVEPISDVTVFNIIWGWANYATALDAWQIWGPNTDERISSFLFPLPQQADKIILTGEFVGGADELQDLLKPMASAGQPKQISIQTMSYGDAVNYIANMEGAAANTPFRVKGNSSFVTDSLSEQAIEVLQEWLTKAPDGASPQFYALGGAISRVAPDATAFPHRDPKLLLTFQSLWTSSEDDQANINWIEGVNKKLRPYTTGGAYINTPDRSLEDWPWAYYGDNFPRLVKVKHHYDPNNVFHFEQSIPVSLTEDEARKLKLPESIIAKLINP